jgi:hypothetical protein
VEKERKIEKRELYSAICNHPEQFLNFWAICFWAVVTGVVDAWK